eukprot:1160190-Pelagomonas_calceolata.AAC.3
MKGMFCMPLKVVCITKNRLRSGAKRPLQFLQIAFHIFQNGCVLKLELMNNESTLFKERVRAEVIIILKKISGAKRRLTFEGDMHGPLILRWDNADVFKLLQSHCTQLCSEPD